MTYEDVLVINCGSSSLKFAVIEARSGHVGHHGLAERLGTADADWAIDGAPSEKLPAGADHRAAPDRIFGRGSSDRGAAGGRRGGDRGGRVLGRGVFGGA